MIKNIYPTVLVITSGVLIAIIIGFGLGEFGGYFKVDALKAQEEEKSFEEVCATLDYAARSGELLFENESKIRQLEGAKKSAQELIDIIRAKPSPDQFLMITYEQEVSCSTQKIISYDSLIRAIESRAEWAHELFNLLRCPIEQSEEMPSQVDLPSLDVSTETESPSSLSSPAATST